MHMRQSPIQTSRDADGPVLASAATSRGAGCVNTILLVDDNDDNRIIYRTILAHAGYRVLECADGKSAIECVRADRPDLVLMDISLPDLDGWEATRILKSDPRTSGIPILALTARAMPEDRVRGQTAGFERYLIKPIEPRQVLEEVKRILGEPSGSSPAEELADREALLARH